MFYIREPYQDTCYNPQFKTMQDSGQMLSSVSVFCLKNQCKGNNHPLINKNFLEKIIKEK